MNNEFFSRPSRVAADSVNTDPATPAKRRRKWLMPTLAGVAVLGLGYAIGSTQAPEPRVETKVETVTKTVEKEVEVPVEIANQDCKLALGYADDIIVEHATYMSHVADILTAASYMDAAGTSKASDKMSKSNKTMEGIVGNFAVARDACLEAGE